MKGKFFLSFVFIVFLTSVSFAASPYFFKGFVHVNGSLAPNGTIVEAIVNSVNRFNVTVGAGLLTDKPQGFYLISFEADSGNNVSFQVNGLALLNTNGTNNATQTLTSSNIIVDFNLSVNKSANTIACETPLGCTGAFCIHSICRSASTFCGDTFCDSGESCSTDDSACGSGQACTNGCVATAAASTSSGGGSSGGGGGGGGGGTTLPSVTQTVNNIVADTPKSVGITESKLPVSQVEITTNTNLATTQLTVKEITQPSGSGSAISSDTGKVYKYLNISSGITSSQLVKVKIKFTVPKSWLVANSINPDTTALNRLVGTTWIKLLTKKTGEDAVNVFYEAESPGLSVFAITGEKAATAPTFAVCGNNVLESGEECDELQLSGQTCTGRGFESGTLKCTACMFDTSECISAGPAPPSEKPAETPAGERPPIILPPVTDVGGIILIVVVLAVLLLGYKFFMKKHVKRHDHESHTN